MAFHFEEYPWSGSGVTLQTEVSKRQSVTIIGGSNSTLKKNQFVVFPREGSILGPLLFI